MQAALEDTVLDAVLTCAFDAPAEKLEAVRKPLKASLHAMALKAARFVPRMSALQISCLVPRRRGAWPHHRPCMSA